MTSAAFEAVLKQQTHASNTQLHALITAGNYSGEGLAPVAEQYLEVFVDSNTTRLRRRWVGIALSHMLRVSGEVAHHLKREKRKLQKLGDILLRNSECEDIKIVAGLVMRQALDRGLDLASFWPSRKVVDSAPEFPRAPGPRWMQEFQTFLDGLGDLLLADPAKDPCIVYAVAVVASDSFTWAITAGGMLIAIVQTNVLTLLLCDGSSLGIQFLDIPLSRIHGTRTQPSISMHDSQTQKVEHSAWDLTLGLASGSWTYLLDGKKHTANDLTIIFDSATNANEVETCIGELQASDTESTQSQAPLRMCRSAMMDVSSSPRPSPKPAAKDAGIESRAQQLQREDDAGFVTNQVARDGSCDTNQENHDRRQQQPSLHEHTRRSSPDPLSHSPSAVARSISSKLVEKPTAAGEISALHKEVPVPAKPTRNTRSEASLQPAPSTVGSKTAGSKTAGSKTAGSKTAGSSTANAARVSERPVAKRTTYSKGKLQKVSQATKLRASPQLREQTDIFEIPSVSDDKGITEDVSNSRNRSLSTLAESSQTKKVKGVSKSSTGTTHGRQTRGKRRTEEDEDFLPTTTRGAKAGVKRKSASSSSNTNKPPNKKQKVEPRPEPNGDNIRASEDADSGTQGRGSDSRRNNAGSRGKPPSSAAVLRTPLISGLVQTQKGPEEYKAAFKKPDVPARAINPSSTPARRRAQPGPRARGPHTPTVQKVPRASLLQLPSSPPICNMVEAETAVGNHGTMEREILSSNSKPLPASPNAESTAISGHADCDTVAIEKENGELQTARSDPFKRAVSTKVTSFTRRLTGEDKQDHTNIVGTIVPAATLEIDESTLSDTESLLGMAARQPRSRPKGRPIAEQFKPKIDLPLPETIGQTRASETVTRMEVHSVEVSRSPERERQPLEQTAQTTQCKTTATMPGSIHILDKPVELATQHRKAHLEHRASQVVADVPRQARKSDTQIDTSMSSDPPQDIKEAQREPADEAQENHDMDEDTTLVNNDSEQQLPIYPKDYSSLFKSSPPGSPSSHSSTSAESDPPSPPRVPTSDAEEMEWEASLQPHQRALHDLLIRVSKRVTRHVVEKETAVTDIAEVFVSDGEHLVDNFLKQQRGAFADMWEDMEAKKRRLKQEMEGSIKALAKERKRLAALT